MSPNAPIALAYCTDDQAFALELESKLGSVANFQHFIVDNANEGPILSEIMVDFRGRILLLVSDNFLRNPNAMLHANRLISSVGRRGRETKAILIDGHRFD
ncbi:MAG: hypothetical protein AAFU03_12230, partial [Bacteroidota bacterium]